MEKSELNVEDSLNKESNFQGEENENNINEEIIINNESESLEDIENNVVCDKVFQEVINLKEKVELMNQLFVKKIQHTEYEEEIVDRMHSELQRYKEDLYSQLVRPILLDIIEIRDSIIRITNVYKEKSEEERNIPLKMFSDYAYDIQDILEKNSIDIFQSKEGDDFNPINQKIVKKVKTFKEELHGKIATSLNSGYDYNGKIISKEKVAIYVYEKQEANEGEN